MDTGFMYVLIFVVVTICLCACWSDQPHSEKNKWKRMRSRVWSLSSFLLWILLFFFFLLQNIYSVLFYVVAFFSVLNGVFSGVSVCMHLCRLILFDVFCVKIGDFYTEFQIPKDIQITLATKSNNNINLYVWIYIFSFVCFCHRPFGVIVQLFQLEFLRVFRFGILFLFLFVDIVSVLDKM